MVTAPRKRCLHRGGWKGAPMTTLNEPGYDVIGDVHGCADDREVLLAQMGYDVRDGAYRHANRTAVFVGDLIDRGPAQLRVLQTVKAMVDAGSARMVLGNHEFNALAYA